LHQTGILAAAGIIPDKRLTRGLLEFSKLTEKPEIPPANLVFGNLAERYAASVTGLAFQLIEFGERIDITGSHRISSVTHHWVDENGIEKTNQAIQAIFAS